MRLELVARRHKTSATEAVFPADFFGEGKPLDFEAMIRQAHSVLSRIPRGENLEVFVTGFTPALTTVVAWAEAHHRPLVLLHYDKQSGSYVAQRMQCDKDFDLLVEAGYEGYCC